MSAPKIFSPPSTPAPETRDSGAQVVFRQGRARPLWYRHPWVCGNAVVCRNGAAEAGDVVSVTDHDGRFIGRGF